MVYHTPHLFLKSLCIKVPTITKIFLAREERVAFAAKALRHRIKLTNIALIFLDQSIAPVSSRFVQAIDPAALLLYDGEYVFVNAITL
jgi:hypothetical protein